MGDVTKLNDLVEQHDLAYVILRTVPGKEEAPHGAQEMANYLQEGFNPFAITFWMEAPKAAPQIMSGTPVPPVMCEKVWMKRTRLVPAPKPLPNQPTVG